VPSATAWLSKPPRIWSGFTHACNLSKRVKPGVPSFHSCRRRYKYVFPWLGGLSRAASGKSRAFSNDSCLTIPSRDILYDLSSVGELPFPNEPSPPDSSAHARSGRTASSTSHHNSGSYAPSPSNSASTGSAHSSPLSNPPSNPYLSAEPQANLFTRSNDLGRLPIHSVSKDVSSGAQAGSATSGIYSSSDTGDLLSLLAGTGSSSHSFSLDSNDVAAFGGSSGASDSWSMTGAAASGQNSASQQSLAQLLGPLANQSQSLIGGDDAWSNMPLGFR